MVQVELSRAKANMVAACRENAARPSLAATLNVTASTSLHPNWARDATAPSIGRDPSEAIR
jgi:hypothetical protein